MKAEVIEQAVFGTWLGPATVTLEKDRGEYVVRTAGDMDEEGNWKRPEFYKFMSLEDAQTQFDLLCKDLQGRGDGDF